ncbi:MAG: biopolymer transporter ExbD [Oricola sp.]
MQLDTAIRRRGAISMTSLIDVIFLLLLFFMLSSTFAKFGEIELTAAGGGADKSISPVYLRLDGDALMLNGAPVELAKIGEALAGQANGGADTVLLSLDDKTSSQRFVDVYATLRAAPGFSVAVLR